MDCLLNFVSSVWVSDLLGHHLANNGSIKRSGLESCIVHFIFVYTVQHNPAEVQSPAISVGSLPVPGEEDCIVLLNVNYHWVFV